HHPISLCHPAPAPPRSPPLFFQAARPPPTLHSFPTRRSSDLCPRVRFPSIWPVSTARWCARRSVSPPGFRSPLSRSVHPPPPERSEEHTSELQSQSNLVCRLLLEKKKKNTRYRLSLGVVNAVA